MMFGFQMTLQMVKSKGIYDLLKLKLTHKRYFINSLTCSDLYGLTSPDFDSHVYKPAISNTVIEI